MSMIAKVALWLLIYGMGNSIAVLASTILADLMSRYWIGLGQGLFIGVMAMLAMGFRHPLGEAA